MMARLWIIAWKEFLQVRRDRLTLGMMAVLPVVQLLLFGFAINTDVRGIATLVDDQDHSAMSRDLVHTLQATGTYEVVGAASGYADIERAFRLGSARAALVIPPRYQAELVAGRVSRVQLVLDGADPQVVGSASSTAASFAAARLSSAHSGSRPLRLDEGRSEFVTNVLYNPELRTAVNIVPGLVGVILSLTMVMLTSMALARERERGTMEQLIVSPIRSVELMLGKILPYVLVGYVQMAMIFGLGRVVFGVPIVGSVALLFAMAFVFIAANLAVGLFFSTIATTQQQAMQMSIFFLLPNILLSGFMFPFESMPLIPRVLSQGLPLTHFNRIVRGIALKGATFADLSVELSWLVTILVVLVTTTSLRFRKKLG